MLAFLESHQQEDVACAPDVTNVPDRLREFHSPQRRDLLARIRLPQPYHALTSTDGKQVPSCPPALQRHLVVRTWVAGVWTEPPSKDRGQFVHLRSRSTND